ncbi:hypothetical protein JAAARDRAFT_49848 [Jaapia argillacea MUCL 33604]|uniref:Uncharacterized protein n=1 Tax=Jaapia argillacea MUCL 33604 TaxID=933084 RepID=A0A067PF30_9AGAM|nr:hypothetical protein JAAARDRAFT_49848 [Jaapia argillacea MUCL 33604]
MHMVCACGEGLMKREFVRLARGGQKSGGYQILVRPSGGPTPYVILPVPIFCQQCHGPRTDERRDYSRSGLSANSKMEDYDGDDLGKELKYRHEKLCNDERAREDDVGKLGGLSLVQVGLNRHSRSEMDQAIVEIGYRLEELSIRARPYGGIDVQVLGEGLTLG